MRSGVVACYMMDVIDGGGMKEDDLGGDVHMGAGARVGEASSLHSTVSEGTQC